MDEQTNEPQGNPDIRSFEEDLLGALFGFHKNITVLLRQPSLDDNQRELVAERIKVMLDEVTAKMKHTNNMSLAGRLESVYEEAKRLVDEMSESDCCRGTDEPASRDCGESP